MKLTQKRVAEIINITDRAYRTLETGRSKPSYDVLVELEKLFQKPHCLLFAETDSEDKGSEGFLSYCAMCRKTSPNSPTPIRE